MRLYLKLGHIAIALISAFTLAGMSAYVERIGPQLVQYGNMCGAGYSDPCYKPVLRGGFPVSYLFDAPGVSRERQLSVGEDKVIGSALVLDIAFYLVVVLLARLAVARRRSASKRKMHHRP